MDCENGLESFSLRWNNYDNNMKTGFHDLLRREDFVDVTIAAEGKLIQAHKMVLSICSPYFKNIFKANPCQHPVVFLKDVTYKELSGIMQFMYLGEVRVRQEELGRFLKTAEALQIKGLTCDDSEENVMLPEIYNKQQDYCKGDSCNRQRFRDDEINLPERAMVKKEKTNSSCNGITRVNPSQPVEQSFKSLVEHSQESFSEAEAEDLDFDLIECDQNSFKDNSGNIENKLLNSSYDLTISPIAGNSSGSKEEIVINLQKFGEICKADEGSPVSTMLTKKQALCPICGKVLRYKRNLQTHIVDQHSGKFGCWPCNICNKVCRTWSALRVHINRHRLGFIR